MTREGASKAAKAAEVSWGVGQEGRVLERWLKMRGLVETHVSLSSVVETSHFDAFLISMRDGLPSAFVEVKVRRIKFATYADSIWPLSKLEWAKATHERLGLPVIGVVEYADALTEVRLDGEPDWVGDVTRTDRGYPVPHGKFARDQHRVWWNEDVPREEED